LFEGHRHEGEQESPSAWYDEIKSNHTLHISDQEKGHKEICVASFEQEGEQKGEEERTSAWYDELKSILGSIPDTQVRQQTTAKVVLEDFHSISSDSDEMRPDVPLATAKQPRMLRERSITQSYH